MNIFRVKTIVNLDPANGAVQKASNGMGECFKSPNWADWPLVANSQQEGNIDWTYPDGVANVLQPDEWLMLQTHYVNATTQKTHGAARSRVNFWTIPDAEVSSRDGHALRDQAVDPHLREATRRRASAAACQINSPDAGHIIGANGHFHSRGKQFDDLHVGRHNDRHARRTPRSSTPRRRGTIRR